MGTFEKMLAMANTNMNYNQKLYRLTKNKEYSHEPFHKEGLGERMSCICKGYCEYETVEYLINHNLKEAYEVGGFSFLQPGDIASEFRDQTFSLYPPTIINHFVNGLALFEWNTTEDGRVWIDKDGYGMRSGNPKFLYGVINQRLEVVGRFRYIDDENKVNEYRRNPHQFLRDFPSSVKTSGAKSFQ